MADLRFDSASAPPAPRGPFLITHSLTACDVGNTLMLKLCGFIEDQNAELLDVSEDCYRLKIGHARLTRFWHGISGHDPLEVTLQIRRDQTYRPETARGSRPANATVEIAVRPLGLGWRREKFNECGHRIVNRLRFHFMAG